LYDFIKNQQDPKAAVIFTHEQPNDAYLVTFFYDGAEPAPGAFGALLDIQPAIDSLEARTYPNLVSYMFLTFAS
jgi:hypothetical protein